MDGERVGVSGAGITLTTHNSGRVMFPMVFEHSGGRDFDLPRHSHYSGVIFPECLSGSEGLSLCVFSQILRGYLDDASDLDDARCSPTEEEVMLSDHQSGRGIPHEATPACREPPMRRYLRCPGAICCPARRALRAVLQPHPVLRRADRRRVEPTAPRMLRLSPPAGCGGCSVRGKRRRCLRVPHRCPCAFPRGRSTQFWSSTSGHP